MNTEIGKDDKNNSILGRMSDVPDAATKGKATVYFRSFCQHFFWLAD